MKTSRLSHRAVLSIAFSYLFVLPQPGPAQQLDKDAVLKAARQSYYNLKSDGFSDFRCDMAPDWGYLLEEQRKVHPNGVDAAVKKLQEVHFLVSLGLDGKAQVMHNEVSADNEKMATGLKHVYGGMQQRIEGFFQTRTAFMFAPLLPKPGEDFQLERTTSGYRFSYKEDGANVATTATNDLVITGEWVKTPQFESTLKPQFTRLPKGLVLSGYTAIYRDESANDTNLSVAISYQQVNALPIPQEITLVGSYGATPFQIKVAFSGCQANRIQQAKM